MAINVVTGKFAANDKRSSSEILAFYTSILNSIKNAYPWTSTPPSIVNGDNIFVISENCSINFNCNTTESNSEWKMTIKCILGNVQKTIKTLTFKAGYNSANRTSYTLCSTVNGLALSIHNAVGQGSDYQSTGYFTEPDYSIFIGHATIDGAQKWGCVYTTGDKSSTYNCFTEDNAVQGDNANVGAYTNAANDVAALYPVVNRATGAVFNDIFIINSSPISNCNAIVNNKKYVFGHRIALLDE